MRLQATGDGSERIIAKDPGRCAAVDRRTAFSGWQSAPELRSVAMPEREMADPKIGGFLPEIAIPHDHILECGEPIPLRWEDLKCFFQ